MRVGTTRCWSKPWHIYVVATLVRSRESFVASLAPPKPRPKVLRFRRRPLVRAPFSHTTLAFTPPHRRAVPSRVLPSQSLHSPLGRLSHARNVGLQASLQARRDHEISTTPQNMGPRHVPHFHAISPTNTAPLSPHPFHRQPRRAARSPCRRDGEGCACGIACPRRRCALSSGFLLLLSSSSSPPLAARTGTRILVVVLCRGHDPQKGRRHHQHQQ